MKREYIITLCDGPTCMRNHSKELKGIIQQELKRHNLQDTVRIMLSGCLGMCSKGPIMIINPGYTIYGKVSQKDIPEIIQQHILINKPVARLVIEEDHL